MSVLASLLTAAAAAPADAHGEASSAGLPQLDPAWWPSQLFWLVVTFGVLYWLMAGRFLPSLGGAIEERRDRIADDLDQASEFKRQADEAEAAYNKALADARAKAQSIAADTRADVDKEIAALQAETDEALDNQLDAAEARIAKMKTDAAEKVREAARDTTRAVVEALIDEAPTDDAIKRAIDNAASA
ncbi:F0F1 ATP synthase subunit B [Hyphococcus sp.]|uniref:F0F1 ATP synthase subunit B family protein n=1 Tax=Hyphococcus sp. TaxID=2038636 RepID=UPI003CCC0131